MKNLLKILSFVTTVAASLLTAGCGNELDERNLGESPSSFTASIEQEGATKTLMGVKYTSGSTTYRPVEWVTGDQIAISGASANYTAGTLTNNNRTATFTGSGAQMEGGLYKAYYPATIYNKTSKKTSFPATQTYGGLSGSKTIIGDLPMYAASSTTSLTFRNLCAVLNFRLKGESTQKVTEIVVTSSDKNLWGEFTIGGTAESPTVTMNTATGGRTVTLNCGAGVALSPTDEKEFFIAIPAQTYGAGTLTIQIKDGTTTLATLTNSSATSAQTIFSRNQIYEIGKTTSNMRYTLEHAGSTVTLTDGTVVQEVVRSLSTSGNTGTAPFNSYRSPNGGTTKEAVDVAYEYAEADADGLPVRSSGEIAWSSTKPSTLSSVTSSGSTAKIFSATVNDYSSPVVNKTVNDLLPHAENLKSRAEVGSSGTPHDLSMYDIHGTSRGNRPVTANCYIVDRAGWYMFPLVYGNAIDYTKSGVALYNNGVNAYAYMDGVQSPNNQLTWHHFQNFAETSISTPYVLDDASLASSDVEAVVVWQDVESAAYSFIENVSVTDISSSNIFYDPVASSYKTSVPYIKFQVPQGSIDADESKDARQRVTGIRQGNAVIAVRLKAARTIAGTTYAAGTILWSWHIWVTDGYDTDGDYKGDGLASLTLTHPYGTNLNMMPVSLGWCDDITTEFYKERVWYVRVRQIAGSADPIIFRVVQAPFTITTNNSDGTYYQWGRKDPFRPLAKFERWQSSTNKPAYSPAAYPLTHPHYVPPVPVSTAIQTPHIIYSMIYGDWVQSYSTPEGIAAYSVKNFWAMGFPVSSKTIYDPCPPGYSVPPEDFYSYFPIAHDLSFPPFVDYNGDGFCTPLDLHPALYYSFYTDRSCTETIRLHLHGTRSSPESGSIGSTGWWTSAPCSNGTDWARNMYGVAVILVYSSTGDVLTNSLGSRGHCLSVYAVEE